MFNKALVALTVAAAFASSAQAQSVLISESFNNVSTLASSGWVLSNLSTAGGTTGWFQGNPDIFAAQSGASTAYIAANFNNAPVGGTIANWLISPTFSTAVAGTVSFYVRAATDTGFFDSLAFGLGGSASSATTSFTNLISVSPVAGAWTRYTVSFAGQGAGAVGRFAFEYFGAADTSNYIGIDSFSVSAVPEPAAWLSLGLGLGALGLVARRKA